jgi:hypothetical protein
LDHSSVNTARSFLTGLLTAQPRASTSAELIETLGITWLRQQGVASLTWHLLQQVPWLPVEVSLNLKRAYYADVSDTELQRHELAEVLHSLREHSVTPIGLKGVALAYTVYPDPACRPMSDLDLLISSEEMLRAQSVLEHLGYESWFPVTRPRALMIRARSELPMFGTRSGSGLVELHWGGFPGEWLQRTTRIDDADLWARAVPATLADQPALILSPEDNLLQVAVHQAINHNMSAPWLRGLVDIALLARHYPIDWNVIVQRARTWRVATAVWLVLSLAVDLAGLQEAAEAARELQPSALRRWLLGRFANAGSLVMMRDLSTSKWRYVFLLLLIDRGRDAQRLVCRALWPEREWLIARYGRYTFTTRLRHLFDAARGKI